MTDETIDSEPCDLANCDIDHDSKPSGIPYFAHPTKPFKADNRGLEIPVVPPSSDEKGRPAPQMQWTDTMSEAQQEAIRRIRDKPDSPELSLLIVDMGDSVCVKVEKGTWFISEGEALPQNGIMLIDKPFAKVKEAISQAPVPRIERVENAPYRLIANRENSEHVTRLYRHELIALNELAGHELPVWSGGTWLEVPSLETDMPTIWRFTRGRANG